MKDLPLTALRALAAVFETGGIRPAGRLLSVTHSAVSRHLRELEALLNTPLFEARSGTNRLIFTAQGEALARASLETLNELKSAFSAAREARHGNTVSIATTPSFAVRWLLPRLTRLQASHPTIEASVIVDQALKSPSEQGGDINIRMGVRPSGSGVVMHFADDELYPVAQASWMNRSLADQHNADLGKLPLLHDRDPHASWAQWKKQFGPSSLDIRRGARFTSSDLVLRAAEQGLGVALARHRLARDAIRAGSLARLLEPQFVSVPDAYWLIVNEDSMRRQSVGAVVEWLRAEVDADAE